MPIISSYSKDIHLGQQEFPRSYQRTLAANRCLHIVFTQPIPVVITAFGVHYLMILDRATYSPKTLFNITTTSLNLPSGYEVNFQFFISSTAPFGRSDAAVRLTRQHKRKSNSTSSHYELSAILTLQPCYQPLFSGTLCVGLYSHPHNLDTKPSTM